MERYFTSEYKKILDALDSNIGNLVNAAAEVANSQRSVGENCKSQTSDFLRMPSWQGESKLALSSFWTVVEGQVISAISVMENNLVSAVQLANSLVDVLALIKVKDEELTAMEEKLVCLERAQNDAHAAYDNTSATISKKDSSGNTIWITNPAKETAKKNWEKAVDEVNKQKADIQDMETILTDLTNKAEGIIGQIRGLNLTSSEEIPNIDIDITNTSDNGLPLVTTFGEPFATGYRYTRRYQKGHFALDVTAYRGTSTGYTEPKVLALGDGVVTGITRSKGAVEILHNYNGEEIYTRYVHLGQINVKKNQHVSANDYLGPQGNKGNSTGPHLHLEMYKIVDGKKVYLNPEDYVDFNVS